MKIDPHIFDSVLLQSWAHGVDFYHILATFIVESSLNPKAVGDGGMSYGLGQLHLQGAGYGHDPCDLLTISYNVEVAVKFMRQCLDATGNYDDAASAYNQGIYGWQKRGRGLNQEYVDKVRYWREKLAAEGVDRLTCADGYDGD
jgi:soluble lytic murein transglycosylase-like protein